MKKRIDSLDWNSITNTMHEKGYATLSGLLNKAQCEELASLYEKPNLYRKTVVMERHRFGLGEYKYFNYPLPQLIQTIREAIYPHLVPIANAWMDVLKMETHYPPQLSELSKRCNSRNQTKSTVLILKYGLGGFNTLHQDLYGEVFFPIQLVLFLSEYGEDHEGGEFVMMQQIPRSQSKAIVLKPKKGDALLFATNFRPVKGKKGYYRVTMKHGVSEVTKGNRQSMGIIFHDALN